MRFLAIIGCAILFSSCATAHKTYLPPSNAKVVASTKKVTDGITKAHSVAREAKTKVESAQKHSDAIAVQGLEVQKKLDAIIKAAPAELQPALAAVKADVAGIQDHDEQLTADLTGANAKQTELDKIQLMQEQDIVQLKVDQNQYETNAQTLANDATNEREARITAEKQLTKEKILSFLWKLGGGVIVLGIITLIVLWWTGKLAFKFAK